MSGLALLTYLTTRFEVDSKLLKRFLYASSKNPMQNLLSSFLLTSLAIFRSHPDLLGLKYLQNLLKCNIGNVMKTLETFEADNSFRDLDVRTVVHAILGHLLDILFVNSEYFEVTLGLVQTSSKIASDVLLKFMQDCESKASMEFDMETKMRIGQILRVVMELHSATLDELQLDSDLLDQLLLVYLYTPLNIPFNEQEQEPVQIMLYCNDLSSTNRMKGLKLLRANYASMDPLIVQEILKARLSDSDIKVAHLAADLVALISSVSLCRVAWRSFILNSLRTSHPSDSAIVISKMLTPEMLDKCVTNENDLFCLHVILWRLALVNTDCLHLLQFNKVCSLTYFCSK